MEPVNEFTYNIDWGAERSRDNLSRPYTTGRVANANKSRPE